MMDRAPLAPAASGAPPRIISGPHPATGNVNGDITAGVVGQSELAASTFAPRNVRSAVRIYSIGWPRYVTFVC